MKSEICPVCEPKLTDYVMHMEIDGDDVSQFAECLCCGNTFDAVVSINTDAAAKASEQKAKETVQRIIWWLPPTVVENVAWSVVEREITRAIRNEGARVARMAAQIIDSQATIVELEELVLLGDES